jgi:hypothetical protein
LKLNLDNLDNLDYQREGRDFINTYLWLKGIGLLLVANWKLVSLGEGSLRVFCSTNHVAPWANLAFCGYSMHLCKCMARCMRIYAYVYVCVCVRVPYSLYVYKYVYVHIYIYHMRMCVCTCECVCLCYVYVYVYAYVFRQWCQPKPNRSDRSWFWNLQFPKCKFER